VRFEILLSPGAGKQLAALPAHVRAEVRDSIELHLRHEPTKLSRSRIKRLRGLEQPQYRLRVAETRVFYDVTETEVHVLSIVSKTEAQAWLGEQGVPTSPGSIGEGEG
jgi:mRNA interferase RelE/StbE